ncbi:MAG: class I SAM-dependent methyltransferase [Ktedonobacteraceae bacterium]
MKIISQGTVTGRADHLHPLREQKALASLPKHNRHIFVNPFQLEDLLIFDAENLCRILTNVIEYITPIQLAWCMYGAPAQLIQHVLTCLPSVEQPAFLHELVYPITSMVIQHTRHLLLDQLFWELTYWHTPELYEELTAGEHLHPGIFEQLEPWLRDKIVLDVGAGSGRASFEAVQHGAKLVYAVEPSPGLRRILRRKRDCAPNIPSVVVSAGDFAHVPLSTQSVDLALSCSAFIAESEQGGESGLAELRRVTRTGGTIVVIWPRLQDRAWLSERGFRYVALPCEQEMVISFASWQSAWRCVQRFYGGKPEALHYLLHAHEPSIPFAVLGFNAPCDYCWLQVT